jgi:hypothetical protein
MDEQTFKKLLDEALEPIKEDISVLKGSVLSIEQIMTSYADSYKINQHNIERVDTRLTTVEEELNITPPEDLKVSHFASK